MRFTSIFIPVLWCAALAWSEPFELKEAEVVAPPGLSGPEKKAVSMLVEEIEKRTQLRFPMVAAWPSSNTPVIAVGKRTELEAFAGPYAKDLGGAPSAEAAEGFRICVKRGQGRPAVLVIGNDARGVLFGVGR